MWVLDLRLVGSHSLDEGWAGENLHLLSVLPIMYGSTGLNKCSGDVVAFTTAIDQE